MARWWLLTLGLPLLAGCSDGSKTQYSFADTRWGASAKAVHRALLKHGFVPDGQLKAAASPQGSVEAWRGPVLGHEANVQTFYDDRHRLSKMVVTISTASEPIEITNAKDQVQVEQMGREARGLADQMWDTLHPLCRSYLDAAQEKYGAPKTDLYKVPLPAKDRPVGYFVFYAKLDGTMFSGNWDAGQEQLQMDCTLAVHQAVGQSKANQVMGVVRLEYRHVPDGISN